MGTPFNPIATVTLAATATSGRVALPGPTRIQQRTLRVAVIGAEAAFLAFGDSAVTATTAASMPVLPGVVEVFSMVPGYTHVAAITATGNVTVSLTIGEGE